MIYNIGVDKPFRLSKESQRRLERAVEVTKSEITCILLDFEVNEQIRYFFIQVDVPYRQVKKFEEIAKVKLTKPMLISGQQIQKNGITRNE